MKGLENGCVFCIHLENGAASKSTQDNIISRGKYWVASKKEFDPEIVGQNTVKIGTLILKLAMVKRLSCCWF